MLGSDSLSSFYKLNFILHRQHNYSLTELDEMYPFEREVYYSFLVQQLEEERQERERVKR